MTLKQKEINRDFEIKYMSAVFSCDRCNKEIIYEPFSIKTGEQFSTRRTALRQKTHLCANCAYNQRKAVEK